MTKAYPLLLLSVYTLHQSYTDAFAAPKTGSGGGFGKPKSAPLIYTPDVTPKTQSLLQFLNSQGSRLSNVEIGTQISTNMRGIYATKAVKAEEILCQIPSDCALALSDPSSKTSVDDSKVSTFGLNFLQMYANDPKAREVWKPYLDALPTPESDFSPTPDFYDDADIGLLEFPRLGIKPVDPPRNTHNTKQAVKTSVDDSKVSTFGLNFLQMYANDPKARELWKPYLDDADIGLLEFPRLVNAANDRKAEITALASKIGMDVDELRFATWLTTSRSFLITIAAAIDPNAPLDDLGRAIAPPTNEQQKVRVLVPFIDMTNHSSDQPNAKLTLLDPEKDDAWFALEATRPIAKGKEITIAYGSGIESSVELLMNYGFTPYTNKIDEFMLTKGGNKGEHGSVEGGLSGWKTSLEQDEKILAGCVGDPVLETIMRIQMKKSYV
eukprot:CAMPEP_0194395214 /NCGR_PEP_ID=MMETSP0174-20130528/124296_1 /TAXON_ID=216777 /ORGANISM="Proboscia alata, Strain PI-D3" /LENGTH=438 /DNA_ID=CAMNT_0039191119 /DNA_START=75 /DNA_END=1390 /DNA_ORIENTATION=-